MAEAISGQSAQPHSHERNSETVDLSTAPSGEAEREDLFTSESEKERLRLYNISFQQDIDERKRYARRAYKITKIWVWFLIGLSTFHLFCKVVWGRGFEATEFMTVVTTTTGSVFGFWWLVGRYLFPTTRPAPIIDPREPLPARRATS